MNLGQPLRRAGPDGDQLTAVAMPQVQQVGPSGLLCAKHYKMVGYAGNSTKWLGFKRTIWNFSMRSVGSRHRPTHGSWSVRSWEAPRQICNAFSPLRMVRMLAKLFGPSICLNAGSEARGYTCTMHGILIPNS